jgi:hypothetical protein
MAISVSCTCGKTLSVKDELAGKRGKCPACGAMLSIPVPVLAQPVAKSAEIEEWGLAPLDDEPKPAKTTPVKPAATKSGVTNSAASVAKPQAQGASTPASTKPAPALLGDDYGLAPFDEEIAKPAAAAAKPTAAKPAAKPGPPASKPATPPASALNAKPAPAPTSAASSAKPPVNGSSASKPSLPVATVAPEKSPLGGPAPALLDLSPLDDGGNVVGAKPRPASAASPKPPVAAAAPSAAKSLGGEAPTMLDLSPLDEHGNEVGAKPAPPKTAAAKPSATPAKKPAAGPAPLDLPPLDGGEEFPRGSLLDEVTENDFKVAGVPTTSNTGQIFAGPGVAAPSERPPGGFSGELVCPFCNKDLDTVGLDDAKPQAVLGLLTGIFVPVAAPFNCRNCGPIQYKQLVGESKKTVKKRAAEYDRRILGTIFFVILFIGIVVAIPLFIMPWWREWRNEARWAESSERFQEQMKQFDESRKQDELRRQEVEKRRQGMFGEPRPAPTIPGSTPVGPSNVPINPQPSPPKPAPPKTAPPKTADPKSTTPATPTPSQVNDFKQEEIKRRLEEARKSNEERRREFEERMKKQRELRTPPGNPRPTPPPSKAATPTPATPPPSANPFQETTLPPTPAPMPVNPFQPID